MYWTVYAASNLPTSLRSPGKNKKLHTKNRRKIRNRSHPYSSFQTMDIDEDVDQVFDKALSKLQKKKNTRLKRAIKKPRKIINNRTAAKQFHMQLKAAINMDIDASNSLVKKEIINNSMSRFSPMIMPERSSDYSLQYIQESQSLTDTIATETTDSSGMFGISSQPQQFYQHPKQQQTATSMGIKDNVQASITIFNNDETDEVEEKFKYLSVNSGNELMNKFSGEYYHH